MRFLLKVVVFIVLCSSFALAQANPFEGSEQQFPHIQDMRGNPVAKFLNKRGWFRTGETEAGYKIELFTGGGNEHGIVVKLKSHVYSWKETLDPKAVSGKAVPFEIELEVSFEELEAKGVNLKEFRTALAEVVLNPVGLSIMPFTFFLKKMDMDLAELKFGMEFVKVGYEDLVWKKKDESLVITFKGNFSVGFNTIALQNNSVARKPLKNTFTDSQINTILKDAWYSYFVSMKGEIEFTIAKKFVMGFFGGVDYFTFDDYSSVNPTSMKGNITNGYYGVYAKWLIKKWFDITGTFKGMHARTSTTMRYMHQDGTVSTHNGDGTVEGVEVGLFVNFRW